MAGNPDRAIAAIPVQPLVNAMLTRFRDAGTASAARDRKTGPSVSRIEARPDGPEKRGWGFPA